MLFTGWKVRTRKIFSQGLRSASRETEGIYFSVRTDLNGK